MVRPFPVVLCLALSFAATIPVQAQDLPQYTTEQLWARTASTAYGWIAVAMHYAKSKGDSVDQFADAVFADFDSGWPKDYGPFEVMRAMRLNFLAFPNTEVEVSESSPGSVRFRISRSYRTFFGESGARYGTTITEWERVLERFHERICAERGMTYHQEVEGDWLNITVERRQEGTR